jgi:hypothetical protein
MEVKMTIYVALLIFTFITYILFNFIGLNNEKEKQLYLKMMFILIYFLFVLRSSSVGRDLIGYEQIYMLTKNMPWSDFSYVYFEFGYILLMKISALLGLSFQMFLSIVYAIMLIPIYILISKYSKNILLSILIYICYQRFEFDMTGIRQAIAMSIVLFGYIRFLEVRKFKIFNYILFVSIAVFFHNGAYVSYLFLLFVPFRSFNRFLLTFFIVILSSFILRNEIFQIVRSIFERASFDLNAPMYFGGNIFFLTILASFFFNST